MRRWRRILRSLVVLGLLICVLLGGSYLYLTRPAQVRSALQGALADRGLNVRQLGSARFDMFSGITFRDLVLQLPEVTGAVTPDRPEQAPVVWQVAEGSLALTLNDLLQGVRTPREIRVSGARIGLVRPNLKPPPDDDDPRTFAERWDWLHTLPRIVARDTEVFLYEPGPQRMLRRRMKLDLEIGNDPSGTLVAELLQTGGSVGRLQGGVIPGLQVRYKDGQLQGRVEDLDLDLLDPMLPDAARAELRKLGLSGRIGCPRWSLDPDSGRFEVEVTVRDAALVVPIEPASYEGNLFAQIREANVTMEAEGDIRSRIDRLAVRWDADLRGAPIRGDLVTYDLPLPTERFDPLGGRHALNLEIEGLQLPHEREFAAFIDSPNLHIEARSILQKYAPDGPVNFQLHLAREQADAEPTFSGKLEALGPAARYIAFPYPVRNTRGIVTFDPGGIDLDLTCEHGSGAITVKGHVNTPDPWTGFQLVVRGRNVPLDQELFAALPDRFQELWSRAAPLGLADVDAFIDRVDGTAESGPLDERVRIDARLIGGSISFDDQRITHSDALLRIRDDQIRIEDFHGYIGRAGLYCSGVLSAGDDAESDHVSIRAAGMALNEDGRRQQQPFIYNGHGDVWGSVGGNQPDTYIARLRDGELQGMIADEGWDVQQGWVRRQGDEQQVLGLEARRGDRWLKIEGDFRDNAGPPGRINLQAGDPQINNLLQHLVPTEWDKARQMLGLEGKGTLRLNLNELSPNQTQADVHLTAERMRPQPVPLPLRNIKAHALLKSDGFDLYEATAACSDGGQLTVDGQGRWSDGERWTRIGISASNLTLDAAFIQAMPNPLGTLLRDLDLRGNLQTVARRLQLEQTADGAWKANGHLRFADAQLEAGLKLDSFTGEIEGSVTVPPSGAFEADARFVIEQGTLAERPIRNWGGRLLRSGNSPRIRIEDLQGAFCGGAITGSLELDPRDSSYEVSLTLRDVRAAELFEAKGEGGLPGYLEGRVFLRGSRTNVSDRVGGGTLRIREAPLTTSRVTAELAAASQRETRPLGDLIKQAEIRFAWEGDLVRLQRVELQTRNLRLVGNGAWNTRSDELRLTMVGSTPEGLRLAIISDLVDAAGQELIQYRISGTSDAPRVEVRPLHTITDALRNLLRGG